MTADPMPAADRRFVEGAVGNSVAEATLVSGGNRHGTWVLRLDGEDRVVLRRGTGDGDPRPLQREAAAYCALDGTGLPVPSLLAADHADGQDRVLVSHLSGSPDLTGAPQVVLEDLVDVMARLHAVDVAGLALDVLGRPGRRRGHVQSTLAGLVARYRATGRRDALIECAVAWASAHVPEDDRQAVLVHGDMGPGNFLHDGARVTGVVDWELAHLGDPLADLAAFAMRCVHGRIDGVADLAVRYAAAAGEPVEPERMAFHQVLAALRIVVMRHVEPLVVADQRVTARLISRVLHRRMLVDALHQALGWPVPPAAEAADAPVRPTPLHQAVIELLRREVLPVVHDDAATSTASAIRLVTHLEQLERTADHRPPPPADLVQRISDGEATVEQALPEVAAHEAWDLLGLRPIMGRLADRRLALLAGSEVMA